MTERPALPAVSLGEIAAAVEGRLVGAEASVTGVASLEEAQPADLAYVDADRLTEAARASRAGAFLVGREFAELDRPQIVVRAPRYAFALAVERLFTPARRPRGVSTQSVRGAAVEIGPDASIWPFVTLGNRATIGARVTLYPGVFVGDGASVGDDSVLHPNVVVGDGCLVGRRVIVHAGTVIGSDGFGYAQHGGRHQKIPQRGIAVIEDDVELGANVTVDRATLGRTVVGRGSKVDNQVQIGHNVTIGPCSILVAQVGIAGSARIGAGVMIGGQAGLIEHIQVGDGARIAAGSGVIRDVEAGETVTGGPAMPQKSAMEILTLILRLPRLVEQLKDLARRVAALESRGQ